MLSMFVSVEAFFHIVWKVLKPFLVCNVFFISVEDRTVITIRGQSRKKDARKEMEHFVGYGIRPVVDAVLAEKRPFIIRHGQG